MTVEARGIEARGCADSAVAGDDLHAVLTDLVDLPVFRALAVELHRRVAPLEVRGVDLRDCTVTLTRQNKHVTSKVLLEGGGYTLLTRTPLAGIE